MRLPLLPNGFNQVIFASVAHDQVDARKGRNRFGVQFGIAAGDDEQRIGMATVCLRDELTRTAVAQVSNGAGVDNVDIGNFIEVPLYKTCCAHLFADSLAISLIHLAA
jgi:hypothetical protein